MISFRHPALVVCAHMADGPGAAEIPERGRPRSRRAVGCLSLLLMMAAPPAAAVGFLLYDNSESSHTAGVGSGLAGLGSAIGLLLMIAAGVLFLVGAAGYIFSAPKDE